MGFKYNYKVLLFALLSMLLLQAHSHPIFVSVTEIEHNAKDQTLEISCKIFTDDFEKTLRAAYREHIDLYDLTYKAKMNRLVSDYIQKHLKIQVDGRPSAIQFAGFEQNEEGTISYFKADNITSVKQATVIDDLLFEYNNQQMNIIHFIVNNERKTLKSDRPDGKVLFKF